MFSRVWLCSYRVKFPGVAEIVDEHLLSVSSKLPPHALKSRPLRRKRRKARSPGLKGITFTFHCCKRVKANQAGGRWQSL
jgi:hypothetical protein